MISIVGVALSTVLFGFMSLVMLFDCSGETNEKTVLTIGALGSICILGLDFLDVSTHLHV